MATLTGKGTSYSFSINIPLDVAKVENNLYFCKNKNEYYDSIESIDTKGVEIYQRFTKRSIGWNF
ncbi:hypothetical protein, partial [uncultured Parabacteroides sp.]|uniref:hypothetical protein n=1 Tax=uncultured Parabacteroides sp. TaxID=512312 RepID=UPI0025DC4639